MSAEATSYMTKHSKKTAESHKKQPAKESRSGVSNEISPCMSVGHGKFVLSLSPRSAILMFQLDPYDSRCKSLGRRGQCLRINLLA
jgi:hypothetical protein